MANPLGVWEKVDPGFHRPLVTVSYVRDRFQITGPDFMATSPDGLSWTPLPEEPTAGASGPIAFGAAGWLALTTNHTVLRSVDGLAWTRAPIQIDEGYTPTSVAYGNGRWVATATRHNGTFPPVTWSGLWSSEDGVVWTHRVRTEYVSTDSDHFTYTGSLGLVRWANGSWVAVETTADRLMNLSRMYTSYDGVTWVRQATIDYVTITDVAWGAGEWKATGSRAFSATDYIYLGGSSDGVTWTEFAAPRISRAISRCVVRPGSSGWTMIGSAMFWTFVSTSESGRTTAPRQAWASANEVPLPTDIADMAFGKNRWWVVSESGDLYRSGPVASVVASRSLPGSGVEIGLAPGVNTPYALQRSTNLVDWIEMPGLLSPTNQVPRIEPMNGERAYFRAVSR